MGEHPSLPPPPPEWPGAGGAPHGERVSSSSGRHAGSGAAAPSRTETFLPQRSSQGYTAFSTSSSPATGSIPAAPRPLPRRRSPGGPGRAPRAPQAALAAPEAAAAAATPRLVPLLPPRPQAARRRRPRIIAPPRGTVRRRDPPPGTLRPGGRRLRGAGREEEEAGAGGRELRRAVSSGTAREGQATASREASSGEEEGVSPRNPSAKLWVLWAGKQPGKPGQEQRARGSLRAAAAGSRGRPEQRSRAGGRREKRNRRQRPWKGRQGGTR